MPEDRRPRLALPWQAYLAATVLALTAAGLVFVYAADRGGDDTPAAPDGFELTPEGDVPAGDPLDIEFTDVDDTTGTIRELADSRPTVVNFFASWCIPCIREMPDFEAVWQGVDDEVQFLGLAVNDRPEHAADIVDRTGITYDWSRDIRGDIANAFGIPRLPATAFVSAGGEVAHIENGAVDQDELRALIEEHLEVPG